MSWYLKWLMQYNKAFVPFLLMAVYVINQRFGWAIPLDEDNAVLIMAAITSLIVHQVPNKKLDE